MIHDKNLIHYCKIVKRKFKKRNFFFRCKQTITAFANWQQYNYCAAQMFLAVLRAESMKNSTFLYIFFI